MSDFLDEIQQELKDEKFVRQVKKFLPYFFAIVVISVIITIVYSWKDSSNSVTSYRLSSVYQKALTSLMNGKEEEGYKSLDEIIAAEHKGFSGIAGLEKAALLLKNNKQEEAIKVYNQIAGDKKIDKSLRELADIISIIETIKLNKDENIDNRLIALSRSDSPWKPIALEIRALWYQQHGNNIKAKEILESIIEDNETPRSIAERAKEILSVTKDNPLKKLNDKN